MSHDPNADWEKFRGITESYVGSLSRNFPEGSETDWIASCYKSFAVFAGKFPSSEKRDRILKTIERRDQQAKRFAEIFMGSFKRPKVDKGEQKRGIIKKVWFCFFLCVLAVILTLICWKFGIIN